MKQETVLRLLDIARLDPDLNKHSVYWSQDSSPEFWFGSGRNVLTEQVGLLEDEIAAHAEGFFDDVDGTLRFLLDPRTQTLEVQPTYSWEGEEEPYDYGRPSSDLKEDGGEEYEELCKRAKALGVLSATIMWTGGGDSGGIDSVNCLGKRNKKIDAPENFEESLSDFVENRAPGVVEVNEGGYWQGEISFLSNTLSYTAVQYVRIDEEEPPQMIDVSSPEPPDGHRCEVCGRVGDCSQATHEAVSKVREGFAPRMRQLVYEDTPEDKSFFTWVPIEEFEDNSGLPEEHHALAVEAIRKISKGTPPWMEPALRDKKRAAFLRLVFSAYPYVHKESTNEEEGG